MKFKLSILLLLSYVSVHCDFFNLENDLNFFLRKDKEEKEYMETFLTQSSPEAIKRFKEIVSSEENFKNFLEILPENRKISFSYFVNAIAAEQVYNKLNYDDKLYDDEFNKNYLNYATKDKLRFTLVDPKNPLTVANKVIIYIKNTYTINYYVSEGYNLLQNANFLNNNINKKIEISEELNYFLRKIYDHAFNTMINRSNNDCCGIIVNAPFYCNSDASFCDSDSKDIFYGTLSKYCKKNFSTDYVRNCTEDRTEWYMRNLSMDAIFEILKKGEVEFELRDYSLDESE